MSERSIFLAALDIADPALRAAYLDQACGGDANFRKHIEELIAAEPTLGSFLDRPHIDIEATSAMERPISEHPGSQIGPYKLLQQIGEGGMGVVYMAEQTRPVQRRVALKIVKPGLDSRQVIARFEAERQALAMMDHQNIAKVLDAGATETGRPYFVMELVHGIPITKYCDDNHFSPRQRLELFIPVCHAIQHAHQKGIIHRDIKPSNVLVCLYDGRPVPKVIDFGVAKAIEQRLTERTLFTQFGNIIGTFEYMSPEQAEMSQLGVDTRSDIYSLGVLLYELLTGTTPLDRRRLRTAALDEMLRMIREEEPPKPSTRISECSRHAPRAVASDGTPTRSTGAPVPTTSSASIAASRNMEPAKLSRLVQGDLDWIVMKCLEKDRTRRYETANGLARDVSRYLSDEAVEACPPSAAYRLTKLVRRNRGPVAAATVVLAALMAGIVGTTWGLIKAEKSRRAEAEQRALAERSREAEAEQRQLAETAREREAARAEAESRERQRAEAAEATALANEQRAKAERDRAEQERQIAEAVNNFVTQDILAATPYRGVENPSGPGLPTVLQAVERAAKLVGKRFQGRPLVEANIRRAIGNSLLEFRQFEEAAEQLNESIRLYRQELGDDDDSGSIRAVQLLAWVRLRQGRLSESEPLHAEAFRRAERTLPENHGTRQTAVLHYATCLSNLRRFDEAEALFKRAIAFYPKGSDGLSAVWNNLASMYSEQGKLEEAEQLFKKSLEEQRRLSGSDNPNSLQSMDNLAAIYIRQHRYDDARSLLEEVLAGERRVFGDTRAFELVRLRTRLENAYAELGSWQDAENAVQQALVVVAAPRSELSLSADAIFLPRIGQYLATAYEKAKRLEDAIAVYEKVRDALAAKFGRDHAATLAIANNLGVAYWRNKQFNKSIPIFEDILKQRTQKLSPTHRDTVRAMGNLGVNYRDAGRLEEAIGLLSEADRLDGNDASLAWIGNALWTVYRKTGKTKEAITLILARLKTNRATLAAESTELGLDLAAKSQVLLDLEAWTEAEPLLRECLSILEKESPDDWRVFNTQSMLGGALLGQGRYAEAEPLLVAGYEGMKARQDQIPVKSKVYLAKAPQRLVDLFTTWNKPTEAAKWKKTLDEHSAVEKPAAAAPENP